jgi:hypothetical protein
VLRLPQPGRDPVEASQGVIDDVVGISELFVPPRAVSYRIRRLRELFGDDLDDPRNRLELQLVLMA